MAFTEGPEITEIKKIRMAGRKLKREKFLVKICR
jgi:hypothetical protein